MKLAPYFEQPQLFDEMLFQQSSSPSLLFNKVFFFEPEGEAEPHWENFSVAIIGVPESRNAYNNSSTKLAPDEIRRQFYQLYAWNKDLKIIDLGNMKIGKTPDDTYEALSEILAFLMDNKVLPIILGGSNDLAFANYLAYSKLEQVVNIVAVDSCFDIGDEQQPIASNAYLNKIILQEPNYLLNYSNVGYQTYMNSPEDIEMMEKMFLDAFRVGTIRHDMTEVEPIVRNAEMMSLDISAVRRPDAPGNPNNSSNGFYGEEICQVARFAGLSDKLSSFGIYEYDPLSDYNNQTSQLIAHILWYLLEGFLNRTGDTLMKKKNNYIRYNIAVSEAVDELVFFCSKTTRRWWMLVPVLNQKSNLKKQYYLPCSERDYETACKDRIPERWWKTYHKLNR